MSSPINMATTGDWRCSQGRTDVSCNPLQTDNQKTKSQEPQLKGSYFAIAVMVGILLAVVSVLWHQTRDKERETANEFLQHNIPVAYWGEGNPLIAFSPEDVEVSTGWKFLSGLHPTVTFRCRIAPSVKSRTAVLCYRPLGTDQWLTVETRVRRDHTVKLTLRDLHRDTPYECFFACQKDGETVKSGKVVFFE